MFDGERGGAVQPGKQLGTRLFFHFRHDVGDAVVGHQVDEAGGLFKGNAGNDGGCVMQFRPVENGHGLCLRHGKQGSDGCVGIKRVEVLDTFCNGGGTGISAAEKTCGLAGSLGESVEVHDCSPFRRFADYGERGGEPTEVGSVPVRRFRQRQSTTTVARHLMMLR